MATLRKRKSKNGKMVYWVDFYHNGRRFVRSTKTNDLQTARLILKEIEAKIARQTFSVEDITPQKSVYLDEFIPEFLEYSKSHKAHKTFLRDELTLRTFIGFAGNRTLASIEPKLIDQYLNKRAAEVKKSTVNIELRHLKAAFSKAEDWNLITGNPFKKIKPFTIPQTAPVFLTSRMLTELEEVIGEHWLGDIVKFDVNTGLRIGELVNVRWCDIDFENRVIKVRQTEDFVTKSKRERNVAMNDKVFHLLTAKKRDGDYVFSWPDGRRMDPVLISKKFKKYVRLANLGEQFSFHSLRHTFASHLVQRGVSLYIVSKLLGHSNLKTTEVYAHLAPETFHDVVSLLDDAEGGKVGLAIVRGGKG